MKFKLAPMYAYIMFCRLFPSFVKVFRQVIRIHEFRLSLTWDMNLGSMLARPLLLLFPLPSLSIFRRKNVKMATFFGFTLLSIGDGVKNRSVKLSTFYTSFFHGENAHISRFFKIHSSFTQLSRVLL